MRLNLTFISLILFVGCNFKNEKNSILKNENTSTVSEIKTETIKVQYSPNIYEERNLILENNSIYRTDYFITVPEISDIESDYEGSHNNADDLDRVVFIIKLPSNNDLRVTTTVKLEYKDGFKDLGGILEELEKDNGLSSYRIAVPRFQNKIRSLPNENRLLRISIFTGTDEKKIFIPMRTASIITPKEQNVFEIEKLKQNDNQDLYPYFVLPVKKYILNNTSDEELSFVTESRVSGVLYRYINEELNKSSHCNFITSGSSRSTRLPLTTIDIKRYKVPKTAFFILGNENEAKSKLIERAFSKTNTSIITKLNKQDSISYTLYILIPKNSADIFSIGSCGALRNKTLPVTCHATHCEHYQCTWMNGDDCWGDLGCDNNGCAWSWTQGCPGVTPGGSREPHPGHGLTSHLFNSKQMEPRTCRKCTAGMHWEVEKYGTINEEANVLGYGIEITNPFKTTTIQNSNIPLVKSHKKAAKILEITNSITLSGSTDSSYKEELLMPAECKLECKLNSNDPECN